MAKSIVETSIHLGADPSGLISGLARADNATRRAAARIDGEVDRLTKSMKRKFAAADIGKSVLTGLGVGSGFAVASLAAEQIAGYWKTAAEHAQKIEASSDRVLKATLAKFKARNTDEQNLTLMLKEHAGLQRQIAEMNTPKYVQTGVTGARPGGFWRKGKDPGAGKPVFALVEQTKQEAEAVAELAAEVAELDVELESLQRKVVDQKLTDFFGAMDAKDFSKDRAADLKEQIGLMVDLTGVGKAVAENMAKQDEETRKLAETFAGLADPSLKFKDQLAQINALQAAGVPIAGGYEAAIRAVKNAMSDDEGRRVNDALSDFFGEMDEDSRRNIESMQTWGREIGHIADYAAEGATAAWVDTLHGVEGAWGNLGETIKREIEAMVVKMLIVLPLMHAIGSGLGALGTKTGWGWLGTLAGGFSGAKAAGGPVEGGGTYLVGEQGPELFRPHSGGTIIPAGQTSEMMSRGGRRGDTYVIDARGADVGQIKRLEQIIIALNGSIEMRSVNAVRNASKRGRL